MKTRDKKVVLLLVIAGILLLLLVAKMIEQSRIDITGVFCEYDEGNGLIGDEKLIIYKNYWRIAEDMQQCTYEYDSSSGTICMYNSQGESFYGRYEMETGKLYIDGMCLIKTD